MTQFFYIVTAIQKRLFSFSKWVFTFEQLFENQNIFWFEFSIKQEEEEEEEEKKKIVFEFRNL